MDSDSDSDMVTPKRSDLVDIACPPMSFAELIAALRNLFNVSAELPLAAAEEGSWVLLEPFALAAAAGQ